MEDAQSEAGKEQATAWRAKTKKLRQTGGYTGQLGSTPEHTAADGQGEEHAKSLEGLARQSAPSMGTPVATNPTMPTEEPQGTSHRGREETTEIDVEDEWGARRSNRQARCPQTFRWQLSKQQ